MSGNHMTPAERADKSIADYLRNDWGTERATGWEKQRPYDLDKIEQQENSREQI